MEFARKQNNKEAEAYALVAFAAGLETLEGYRAQQTQIEELYKQALAVYHDGSRDHIDALIRIGKAVVRRRDSGGVRRRGLL